MTDQLYYDDAYTRTFDATITGVDGARVALDRTAFYPGGGGQLNDTGWLTIGDIRMPVTKVKKEAGKIWHWLDTSAAQTDVGGEPSIIVGQAVQGELDWDRRYRIMRTHTAMHILCGVVWRDYGASVTGGNMDPGKGRMDFEFAAMSRELVTEIEAKCNAEIAAARVPSAPRSCPETRPSRSRT